MLHNIKELNKFDIIATDGAIGTVHDFVLDEKHWTVRYLVVDTMKWLPGRKVLISPMSIKDFDLVNGNIEVSLTKEKIKNSPELDEHLPITKNYEVDLIHYYGLRPYWSGQSSWGEYLYPTELASSQHEEKVGREFDEENTLRSFSEISGYSIEASDGNIGHVENFVICDQTWKVRYLVVDTKNWWVGKHVLTAPQWISYISWPEKIMRVDLNKAQIENGPEYNPDQVVTKEFEDEIFTKYDKPKYW
jgi:sporulation protein YlmC with PRC-barrel domain